MGNQLLHQLELVRANDEHLVQLRNERAKRRNRKRKALQEDDDDDDEVTSDVGPSEVSTSEPIKSDSESDNASSSDEDDELEGFLLKMQLFSLGYIIITDVQALSADENEVKSSDEEEEAAVSTADETPTAPSHEQVVTRSGRKVKVVQREDFIM